MTQDIFVSVTAKLRPHIVPFRTAGRGSPLFCFPGSGGNVDIFREMVAVLPEGHPVYVTDMEWLCEEAQYFTIEQLGAFYLDVIRQIQQNGPYYFCGYSFGGLVAYEIATRLINEGDSASLIALLDASNPALKSSLSEAESAQFRRTYLIDRLERYGLQLVRGDIKAFMSRGFAFIISRAGKIFVPLIKIVFRMVNRSLPRIFRGVLMFRSPVLLVWYVFGCKIGDRNMTATHQWVGLHVLAAAFKFMSCREVMSI
jgi:pimeloyl-ACP methyl ester carboxylesterase